VLHSPARRDSGGGCSDPRSPDERARDAGGERAAGEWGVSGDSGRIVGVIHQAKADDEKPEFTIVRRDLYPGQNERKCEHGKFILDEQWATVECGLCGERVEPFAALMSLATHWQRIEQARYRAIEAEKATHRAELKRLSRLRDATDEEKAEIQRLAGWGFGGTVKDLREATSRIGRAISTRKMAKRKQRRLPHPHP
jgi:hypothetical protein